MGEKMYYTYILRCIDNSLYTGITTDLKRRMDEHSGQGEKCAKYTLRHKMQNFEIAWETENRVLASKLEYHIKTLTKLQKEELIKHPRKLKAFLGEKIDCKEYKKVRNFVWECQ